MPVSRSTTTDDLGEFLMRTLTPVSSKKRPAYEAAKEARRMVAAEIVEALPAAMVDGKATQQIIDYIERRFGGQDGA